MSRDLSRIQGNSSAATKPPLYSRNATTAEASSENSQSTSDGHDVATPPTSNSEGFSSQSTNQDGSMAQLSQLSQLATAAQRPLTIATTRPNLTISPTAGQKRTADGQVKESSAISSMSPRAKGHSRNASAVSNTSAASSRIGEISAELRTRLSYAMVKVNNGWQSNSIDEVESLASQAGSPTSSSSTLHGRRKLITSPREAIATVQGQALNVTSAVLQGPSVDFDLYSTTGQPSRTYESFWRDHSAVNNPADRNMSQKAAASPSQPKGLAPPADIRPTLTSRRPGTPKFSKPPAMPGGNSNSSLRSTPRTPNRGDYRENPVIQTPTQKTIQEQDAIETLLFMSSPGNSGNMAHVFPPRSQASPQCSPLRAEFQPHPRSIHGKKVGFDIAAASDSAGSEASSGARHRRAHPGTSGSTKEREAAIDRMLEEMPDSSSGEEDLPIPYKSPRHPLPVGR
ncbi:hypothetical protein BJ875DRAFT_369281 [Amylocarpus encephaloides]|uniref:Uncharacterized protein n=1 Tax=Amylocarpus encephaloides TaxID=45428 RepID=A0A9P7YQ69_9HELO|nr:hypothetical protein BJ875DRAFT_369281 [Amylocarpus encephaloides]